MLQNTKAILCGIAPKNGTECFNCVLSPAIVGAKANVADVRPELGNDLIHISQLLWGKICVIQNPVVCFAIFVPCAEKIHCVGHKSEHFIASLYAPGMILDLCAAEICAGQIDGFKKFINAAAVFDFELRFQLLYG